MRSECVLYLLVRDGRHAAIGETCYVTHHAMSTGCGGRRYAAQRLKLQPMRNAYFSRRTFGDVYLRQSSSSKIPTPSKFLISPHFRLSSFKAHLALKVHKGLRVRRVHRGPKEQCQHP